MIRGWDFLRSWVERVERQVKAARQGAVSKCGGCAERKTHWVQFGGGGRLLLYKLVQRRGKAGTRRWPASNRRQLPLSSP